MGFYLSPLVDIKEVDLTTTIPAVSTATACIVLRNTYKGPELTREYITSEEQLIDIFGYSRKRVYSDSQEKTVSNCYEDLNNAIAFLKDGNSLYCTRIMPDEATFAGVTVDAAGIYDQFDAMGAQIPLKLNSETMEGDLTDPDEFAIEMRSSLNDSGDDLWLIAANRGSCGNKTRITLIDKLTQTNPPSGTSVASMVAGVDEIIENDEDFLIIVESIRQGSKNWEIVEINNVSLNEDSIDDQGMSNFAETYINNRSKYIKIIIKDSLKNDTVPNDWVTETPQVFGGGKDYDSDDVSIGAIIEAYELYKNAEEVDVNIFIDSNKPLTVKNKLIEICNERKDAMVNLDPPLDTVVNNKGSEVTDLVAWRKETLNANTSYAATYGNWFNIYDKYLKDYVWVPVSGYMAGIFARTDQVDDPWFAPAGLNRSIITGIRKLAWNPGNIGERDKLYKNGINPIVSFTGQGKVVFGQKNLLDKSSAFNRINVRRLFMVLQKASSTASKYFLFEPNDRFTQRQIKGMIEPFLQDVQSRRGITDFRVVCDSTNNTPARIDRNELWVDIYIQPTRAAEFIVLRFVATQTGASFEELIGEAT